MSSVSRICEPTWVFVVVNCGGWINGVKGPSLHLHWRINVSYCALLFCIRNCALFWWWLWNCFDALSTGSIFWQSSLKTEKNSRGYKLRNIDCVLHSKLHLGKLTQAGL